MHNRLQSPRMVRDILNLPDLSFSLPYKQKGEQSSDAFGITDFT
jgi:hypothetical protein